MEKGSIRLGVIMSSFNEKEKQIPVEFKKIAKEFSEKGFVLSLIHI